MIVLGLAVFTVWSASAGAQPTDDTTAVDALRCWRRASRNAVFVGQQFTMTVTCRLVDTDTARTQLDPAALEPATLDVAPFEVLSGERFDDVSIGPYRFLQYQYTLRLVSERFGDDVELPAIEADYRIERRLGDSPGLLGRELNYVLPPEPVRLVSLVPDSMVAIRDLPPVTLGTSETREFRANLLSLLAGFFGLAAIAVVGFGAARIVRDRAGDLPRRERRLPPATMARCALDELTRVRHVTVQRGWTPEQTGHALAALRVASALASSHPVAHVFVDDNASPRNGQLRLRAGWPRPRVALISSGLTASSLINGDSSDRHGVRAGGTTERVTGDFSRALSLFTRARYGRPNEVAGDELSQTLRHAIEHTQRLGWTLTAPVRHAIHLRDRCARMWRSLTTGRVR
ncbi:MAG: hypothetical protein VYE68_17175 [Acidobacteriota bacterium]|nr:hypothetical protein [Acidobacteriota bacterium]